MTHPAAVTGGVLLVLAVATAYEAAVALGAIELGSAPGEGPAHEGAVLAAAVVAMLGGAALALVTPSPGHGLPRAFTAALAPTGAAFALTRWFTYDPYYLPTLRRMSDAGLFPPAWMAGLAAAAVAAGALVLVRPRAGSMLSAGVLVVCACTAWLADTGH